MLYYFQLLDFVSMNHASEKFDSQGSEGGWYRIGWAFLKVHTLYNFSKIKGIIISVKKKKREKNILLFSNQLVYFYKFLN